MCSTAVFRWAEYKELNRYTDTPESESSSAYLSKNGKGKIIPVHATKTHTEQK